MISEKLLSEILQEKASNPRLATIPDTNLVYLAENGTKVINIFELAQRCKKYANRKGFELKTDWYGCSVYYHDIYKTRFYNKDGSLNDIDACEYIFELIQQDLS